MSKVPVLSPDGSKKGDVKLPDVFATPYRPDIIAKAVQAARANRRQAYGPAPMAGARHSTASAGKGRGLSRVPRIKSSNAGALAPPTVGGRRAHPPTPRRVFKEKVNVKERRLAIRSAVAATSDRQLVASRGHRLGEKVALPLVVDAAFEKLASTQDLIKALDSLGLGDDLVRATEGRHVRAGRGKMRGRRIKRPKSLLIVAQETQALRKGAGNLTGIEVITPELLDAERLAPGGVAGRLTLYTEPAFKALEAMK